MSNETHGIVGVSVEWQFDDAHNLFLGGVSQIFILVVIFLVCRVEHQQFSNLTSISRTQASFFANLHVVLDHVPEFDLVVLVNSQKHVLFEHVHRVPDACSGEAFLFDLIH